MGFCHTRVFDVVSNFLTSFKEKITINRRSFKRDVEEEEEEEIIQFESTQCVPSSYYSVFVVRLAMMIMLAILIGLLTLLTWHITRVYTKRSLNTLAYGLQHELLQRPLLRMWNILNSTVEVATAQVKLSESVIKRYNKPVNQAQQVELYEVMKDVTWAMFASRKALNSITLNYRNGFVQAFHRNHKSNNTYYIFSDLSNYTITTSVSVSLLSTHKGWNDQAIRGNTSAIWYQEPLDPITGERIGKPKQIPPDELINIAGISQVPEGAASWHVAVSKYSDSSLLSAALPVWDVSHESIVAVVGVTTAFYSVGQLMKELVEFHSGHIYLTSQEGWLLATSTNTPLVMNSTSGPTLLMAIDSKDNVIRSGAERLLREYGDTFPPSDQEVHIENAKVGGELYYIDSFFLNLKRLPMVGVIMIPREYIMGKVDGKAFKTLMIIISASVCILLVGCFCIFILTNGVSKEMKLRAALIRHLDARRKAEASNNYKSQFLANMSHELRTPMAAVIGLLDILMSDDCLTNEQHSTVTQIRKCSTTLLRLLNNILDLSKVESGKLVLEETEFELGRELEGLIDMFSVQCINQNVETVLDLSDDMPRLVHGDSGRVLQIFANLISNSIKFTTSGYIILRGWCENAESYNSRKKHKGSWCKWKRELSRGKNDNKMVLWFEVDDTGCGIDPNKWESVFESFEQADPSTTRLHGGTGLGLCIVRTMVNKMHGEIKVIKKSGPGTLMQLYMLLKTPPHTTKLQYQLNVKDHNFTVLLALRGRMTRLTMTQWLQKNGVSAHEASDWNELTLTIEELVKARICVQNSQVESARALELAIDSDLVIFIDIGLLELSSLVWKQQLSFLDKYYGRANFAWILNHDTSNATKAELHRKGHLFMVNGPLYKAKIIQILEAVKTLQTPPPPPSPSGDEQFHELLEIDGLPSQDSISSEDSDKFENEKDTNIMQGIVKEHLDSDEDGVGESSCKGVNERKPLEGLRIILAEDTPVLQRVATIMLEKMGAKVVVVGDGIQAVDALKEKIPESLQFDLILMDCQMPKMDGYEATKAIRRSECGTGLHIPIVALTAHAMSCDETKCLQVGMDAYLTKPIDCKLMVQTILSLTKKGP